MLVRYCVRHWKDLLTCIQLNHFNITCNGGSLMTADKVMEYICCHGNKIEVKWLIIWTEFYQILDVGEIFVCILLLTPWCSWNTANVGVKHQSIHRVVKNWIMFDGIIINKIQIDKRKFTVWTLNFFSFSIIWETI